MFATSLLDKDCLQFQTQNGNIYIYIYMALVPTDVKVLFPSKV